MFVLISSSIQFISFVKSYHCIISIFVGIMITFHSFLVLSKNTKLFLSIVTNFDFSEGLCEIYLPNHFIKSSRKI
ncbi:MAG: hypothetical protein WCG25_00230 [bacterium]